jgi:hypothetical protein
MLCTITISNLNIRFQAKPSDIPDENVYKHVGPSGRLRAFKRGTAGEPGLSAEMRARRDPIEVWHPHDKQEKVPPADIVDLEIGIWPGGMVFAEGESIRLEIKGHDPILPEYGPLKRNIPNLNVGKHYLHTGGNSTCEIILSLLY